MTVLVPTVDKSGVETSTPVLTSSLVPPARVALTLSPLEEKVVPTRKLFLTAEVSISMPVTEAVLILMVTLVAGIAKRYVPVLVGFNAVSL